MSGTEGIPAAHGGEDVNQKGCSPQGQFLLATAAQFPSRCLPLRKQCSPGRHAVG
jgi:hypothetical protein